MLGFEENEENLASHAALALALSSTLSLCLTPYLTFPVPALRSRPTCTSVLP